MNGLKVASLALAMAIWLVGVGRLLLHLRFGYSEYMERRLELQGAPEWFLWIVRRRRELDNMLALWCAIGVVVASVGFLVSAQAT